MITHSVSPSDVAAAGSYVNQVCELTCGVCRQLLTADTRWTEALSLMNDTPVTEHKGSVFRLITSSCFMHHPGSTVCGPRAAPSFQNLTWKTPLQAQSVSLTDCCLSLHWLVISRFSDSFSARITFFSWKEVSSALILNKIMFSCPSPRSRKLPRFLFHRQILEICQNFLSHLAIFCVCNVQSAHRKQMSTGRTCFCWTGHFPQMYCSRDVSGSSVQQELKVQLRKPVCSYWGPLVVGGKNAHRFFSVVTRRLRKETQGGLRSHFLSLGHMGVTTDPLRDTRQILSLFFIPVKMNMSTNKDDSFAALLWGTRWFYFQTFLTVFACL